jgi:hypothetical protein
MAVRGLARKAELAGQAGANAMAIDRDQREHPEAGDPIPEADSPQAGTPGTGLFIIPGRS